MCSVIGVLLYSPLRSVLGTEAGSAHVDHGDFVQNFELKLSKELDSALGTELAASLGSSLGSELNLAFGKRPG